VIKPNFLIIGAPKCGTTSLSQSLAAHPDVFFFDRKEANFFNRHYDRGFEWYAALFRGQTTQTAIGEGTPAYAMGAESALIARRIHTHLPDVRLVYMVRHPLARIESHHVQDMANGLEGVSLSQAVLTRPHLVQTSQYHARLQDYLSVFDAAQIHVIFFEDFVQDYHATFARCLDFLGVSPQVTVAQTAAGTRETRSRQRWLVRQASRLPFYDTLRNRLPERYVDRVRGLMRKKVDLAAVDMTWTSEAREYAVDALAADSAAFLAAMHRPADLWDLNLPAKG